MIKLRKEINYALIGILAVVVIFLILILNSQSSSSVKPSNTNTSGSTPAPLAVANGIANVPQATLTKIGLGTITNKPLPIKAPALTNNKLPEVLYEGAEFCPYCATERWAMGVALAKFGTFSNLRVTHSSTTDVYPNTQTLSFYKTTYSSKYINFTPIEVETNIASNSGGYTTLQTPTSAENKVINKYDATPYLPAQSAGAIPFIDFGGKYLISGATYSPQLLHGLNTQTIAQDLSNPNSQVAKGADGAANTIIAAICTMTKNTPSTVCTSLIKRIEIKL